MCLLKLIFRYPKIQIFTSIFIQIKNLDRNLDKLYPNFYPHKNLDKKFYYENVDKVYADFYPDFVRKKIWINFIQIFIWMKIEIKIPISKHGRASRYLNLKISQKKFRYPNSKISKNLDIKNCNLGGIGSVHFPKIRYLNFWISENLSKDMDGAFINLDKDIKYWSLIL